jgi:hypothetical protein
MVQAVIRPLLTAEARVLTQAIPCEFCGGQSGTGTDLSPSTSVFHCQYHSTNTPHASSSTCCSCKKDKRAKPGCLRKKKQCSFGNRGSLG